MMKTLTTRLGYPVSPIGLGGEGVLRTTGRKEDATKVILAAIKMGVTYFDSARVYRDSELYYGEVWRRNGQLRESVFQTSKSASRDRAGALADLRSSLQRLGTDYLDLWQIHDLRSEEEFAAISRPGGALEAFVEAREKGLVRYIGVTGHHDPGILTRAVQQWPVDTVLLPVNPVESLLGGFLTETLPAAKQKGLAIVGMKVLGGSHYLMPDDGITATTLLRYALAQGISLPIVGCSTVDEVKEMTAVAELQEKLPDEEVVRIQQLFAPHAVKLAYYRGVK